MRSWIKLHTEIIDDHKIARLTDRQFRLFILGLALAGAVDRDGELMSCDELAWRLRLDESGVADDLLALTAAGLFAADPTGEVLTMPSFARRNACYPSDSNAATAQRVREHRQRAQAQRVREHCQPAQALANAENPAGGSNDDVTTGNERVTSRNDSRQDIEQEQDTEREREQETEKKEKQTSSDARATRKGMAKTGDDGAGSGSSLSAQQYVSLQFLKRIAPDFRGAVEFIRHHNAQLVGYWTLAAGLHVERLDNPAGLIRAMVEKGEWPELPGTEIQKWQTQVRTHAWRNERVV